MNSDKRLVVPPYVTIVQREETTHGDPCYVARHPELQNCMGQGDTSAAAVEDLREATEMVIQHLIAHGLPVPAPQKGLSMTATSGGTSSLPAVQRVKSVPAVKSQMQVSA